jgi:hypothetical protein
MAFDYLPIMAASGAPKPPRVLAPSPELGALAPTPPLAQLRVAIVSSAALRLTNQLPFTPREDLSYRVVPSDPAAGDIVIDHHSGIGRVPRQDPEIVFPRTALAALADRGIIGGISAGHLSFLGGMRCHGELTNQMAPAMADELRKLQVDLALLVPY